MPLPLQFDDIHRVDFGDLSSSSRSRKSVDTGSLAEKVRTSGRQACGDEGGAAAGSSDDAVVSRWYGCSLAESLSVSGTKVEVQES
jgi:hypothetical protein